MEKAGAVLLGLFILSGCALPVPFRIATWAIDGISFVTTKKSISDHGISLIFKRDCAIWRSIIDENICDEFSLGEKDGTPRT